MGRTPLRSPLPVRDGVGATRLKVPRTGAWPTISAYVAERFGHVDPEGLLGRFDRGEVVDITGTPIARDTPLGATEFVWYYRELPVEKDIPFDVAIVHQDDDLVVVDKPHFLPTTPGGGYVQNSALVRLRVALDNPDLTPIHRLDRVTAGLVMFSARAATRGAYQTMFAERTVEKVYEAVSAMPADGLPELPRVVRSRLSSEKGRLRVAEEVEGEPNAETVIELIRAGESSGTDAGLPVVHTLLHPRTGRMHQLRAHLAGLGLGILNDRFYPVLEDESPDDFTRPLQLLARELRFTDPLTGAPREFRTARVLQEAPR
jgi:tRNA pseudouridine32 synthase / 23S rRNA pseudouridine746 synthase